MQIIFISFYHAHFRVYTIHRKQNLAISGDFRKPFKCYAEVGTLIPKSGGEYAILFYGLDYKEKQWGKVPAFMFAWTSTTVLKPASLAILSLPWSKISSIPKFKFNKYETVDY